MVGRQGLGYLQSMSSLHGAMKMVATGNSGPRDYIYMYTYVYVIILFNSHNKQERMLLCPFYREEKQDLKSLETGPRPQSKHMAKLGAVAEDYRLPSPHPQYPFSLSFLEANPPLLRWAPQSLFVSLPHS